MTFEIARLQRVRRTIAPTANIRDGQIVGTRSKPNGAGGWTKEQIIATSPAGFDIWRLQHGTDNWVRTNGKPQLERKVVPFDQPRPETPAGGYDIYLLPIHTAELGGGVDLVFDDAVSSEALAALCTEMQTWDEYHSVQPLMIPHVEIIGTEETDDGIKPIFSIIEWAPRPNNWGPALLKPQGTTVVEPKRKQRTPEELELVELVRNIQSQNQKVA